MLGTQLHVNTAVTHESSEAIAQGDPRLQSKLTVQVWVIIMGIEGFFHCVNDRVAETRLAETYYASQREPVATVLLVDLKYGFVYNSAWVHSSTGACGWQIRPASLAYSGMYPPLTGSPATTRLGIRKREEDEGRCQQDSAESQL